MQSQKTCLLITLMLIHVFLLLETFGGKLEAPFNSLIESNTQLHSRDIVQSEQLIRDSLNDPCPAPDAIIPNENQLRDQQNSSFEAEFERKMPPHPELDEYLMEYTNVSSGSYTIKHIAKLLKQEPLFPKADLPYPLHFITYSTENYRNTRDRLVRQAIRTNWFKSVVGYSPMDLPLDFQEEFQDVLERERGGGYWIWRFPILEKALDRVPPNHYILFADAGCSINSNAKQTLITWLQQLDESPYDELAFSIPIEEHTYTTSKVFQAFNITNNGTIAHSIQTQGGVALYRNGPHIRRLLAEIYMRLSKDPLIITDDYNHEAAELDPEFVENRHDQSIHSIARRLFGAVIVPWPGNSLEDNNPIMATRLAREPIDWEDVLEMEKNQSVV